MHTCCVCEVSKPSSEFYKKDRDGRRDTTCKKCRISRGREKRLGVTDADYKKLYTQQKGKCGICQKRLYSRRYKAFAVDHCHNTGRIRGLLCTSCNTGLGLFKDDPVALTRAREWVEDIVRSSE